MRKLLWLLLLLAPSAAHAACTTLGGSPSQATLQAALNSCASGGGGTQLVGAGSTSITSTMTLPCNVVLQGPTATPATAKITTSTANISLFYADNCTGGASTGFEYLQLDGAGALHTNGSSFSNFVFRNNQTTNVPSEYCNGSTSCPAWNSRTTYSAGAIVTSSGAAGLWQSAVNGNINNTPNSGAQCGGGNCWNAWNQPCVSCQSIYFNFNSGISLTNLDIEYNSFGDSNSCLASAGSVSFDVTSDNFPGNCAGLIIASQNPGAVVNLTLQYNNFFHLEEGFHMQNVGFNGGQPTSYCNGCLIQYNWFSGIRRIQVEYQAQMLNNPLRFRYNVMGPPDYSSANAGQYAFSLPCCQFGATFGATTNTFVDASSNIIYDPNSTGSTTNGISWGYEAWGWGNSSYSNNLMQGYVCVGAVYGFVTSATQFANNTMQGAIMAQNTTCTFAGGGAGGFIGPEFGSCGGVTPCPPPTISGNVQQSTPTPFASQAPTISPSAGSQTYPLTVTLTDAGYTTGTLPLGNTGIWYTTDGSTPVQGTGTALRLDTGGTFVISGPATVKAIGMWGAANQPVSYPPGFGFTASSVVSAAYTGGSTVATPVLSPTSQSFNGTLSVTVTDSTPSSSIFYTTDGTTPTPSSTPYTGAISVTTTTTIKAMATASGLTNSAVGTGVYTQTQAATPVLSPMSQAFTTTLSVSVSDSSPSPTIYCTTDGTTPTTGSPVYSGPFSLTVTTTIKCIATSAGYANSAVGSGVYTQAVAGANVFMNGNQRQSGSGINQ